MLEICYMYVLASALLSFYLVEFQFLKGRGNVCVQTGLGTAKPFGVSRNTFLSAQNRFTSTVTRERVPRDRRRHEGNTAAAVPGCRSLHGTRITGSNLKTTAEGHHHLFSVFDSGTVLNQ